jgi:branched-chain amino acid transport system ATP-binding protein
MSALLEIRSLDVCYGDVKAVHGIDLSLGSGEIVTIIGPNGAGKTTTLNAIMGVLPGSGSIRLDGVELGKLDIEERVARGLCLVPEQRALFGLMSVEDNLILGGYSWHRLGSNDLISALPEIFDLFPRLKERRRQIANTLSGGERQMLAIGRALMGRPRVLLLDEPSLGLAPRIVREVLNIVRQLRERGVSILIVEQNAWAALKIADRGYVLEMGRIAIEGRSVDLAQDQRVVESYLGLGSGTGVGSREYRRLTN